MDFELSNAPNDQYFCASPRLGVIPQETIGSRLVFNIGSWRPQLRACQRYFIEVAQYTTSVEALAAFINIRLPFQKNPYRISDSEMAETISLVPYICRLVATGQDTPLILHSFFGDDWISGVGALHELERRNYLFAAKSSAWMDVKKAYDILPNETVPFLSPLINVTEEEMKIADKSWSDWIFMQDWILGPRFDVVTRQEIDPKT